ncbi:MAG: vWA domain-containing protein [Patescibacteria group bacterium]
MKKITLGLIALLAVVGGVAAMSAFEAHVINVVAKIENALSVSPEHIDFGTVFPQEELYEPLNISLSQSFLDEDRVDDVEYRIRQKPKCGITTNEGTVLTSETATGHVSINEKGEMVVNCGDAPRALEQGESWGQLPLLCPYLSKHKDVDDLDQDEELDAFHPIGHVENGDNPANPSGYEWVWNDVRGRLSKLAQDITDNWVIDLKTPCFGGYCAQDWADFVTRINPNANPADYVQPIANEHKIFGCDLWVEVYNISLPDGLGCRDKADVMQVLDRSGSISSSEMAVLKTAAKAFVSALAPESDGVHMGQTSFSDNGTLDLHLTDNVAAINLAIDGISPGGYTNLKEGIELATAELANPGDTHDRADVDSPDYMVIITDGAPNEPGTETQAKAAAIVAANAADTDGIIIYVVGVGTSEDTANWLKNNIATTPAHYFDASDWNALQQILESLAGCDN